MTSYSQPDEGKRPAYVERIYVGSVDITNFRGQRTPDMQRKLVEPFGYGSGVLTVPQVRPFAESDNFGTGDLSWVREGLIVRVQACDPDTGAVLWTRYRGRTTEPPSSGASLVWPIAGLWTGLAETRNKQVPVVRQVKDIGWWAWAAFARSGEYPGVQFAPQEGPTTGIEIAETGGMTELSWAQQVCSMGTRANGDQWTIMPTQAGGNTFEMRLKDITTVHASVQVDGYRVVQNLERGEHFNSWFLTGVTKDGMYWDGLVLPGVEEEDDPPTYPGTLQQGDSGEDVLTLNWRLLHVGLLDGEIATANFDANTADAISELQDRADLPQTGKLDKKTWNALWDVDTNPWTLAGARIEPMVQDKRLRKWAVTPNGSYLGLNPNYDPTIQRRDRNVDFGSGITAKRAKEWARGQMKRLGDGTRTGTITLNGVGVISGQWLEGSAAPDASRIISARDIQAGWNLWLANHEGGTLVHVAEVDINPGDPDTVTLTVDTGYRDAAELSEILARNKDSLRDLRREWVHEQRGSKQVRDEGMPWHRKAGIVTRKKTCPANTWSVIPVFAGNAGTLSWLRIETETPAEFAVAIFANKVTRKMLNDRIGDPFPVDADGETVWSNPAKQDFYKQQLLVYSAGNAEQPCGYWPKKKTNRDRATTSAPLTGVWQDDASFGYYTGEIPALWVAIRPKTDTTIKRGRILKAQLDFGV